MRAIMVQRSDSGTYEIPGAATAEDWDEVLGVADGAERMGALKGWGDWSEVYRVTIDERDLWYFVGARDEHV